VSPANKLVRWALLLSSPYRKRNWGPRKLCDLPKSPKLIAEWIQTGSWPKLGASVSLPEIWTSFWESVSARHLKQRCKVGSCEAALNSAHTKVKKPLCWEEKMKQTWRQMSLWIRQVYERDWLWIPHLYCLPLLVKTQESKGQKHDSFWLQWKGIHWLWT
jgi:hypothetical protein